MSKKALFLDRDGVINYDYGYVHTKEKFDFVAGVFKTLLHAQNKGYLIIIITNQSGIGRGMYSLDKFMKLNNWMIEEFEKNKIKVNKVLFCPHSPSQKCLCRKPLPKLFLEAKEKFQIDMEKSWAIGDKETDIKAANSAGVLNTVLLNNNQKARPNKSQAKYVVESIVSLIKIL